MERVQFQVPTALVAGPHIFREWLECCHRLGIKRPLLVTGRQMARRAGLIDQLLDSPLTVTVYDEITPNPGAEICEIGARVCREEDCDGVIGLGGGSVLDAAKAIALLARNPGSCQDYFGAEKFSEAPLPVIAIPTTAGTGSEVTPYAVLVDEATGQKRTISGRRLFPKLALLDPVLCVSLPLEATRDTGLDVLSQAMEGMVSRRSSAMCDLLALDTIRLVYRWLPRAMAHPDDLEARANMLLAAALSGMVIAHTGTTLVHGMGYYYTLDAGVPHGLANGLLLTPVFQFNALHLPEKVAAMAEALGHPCPSTPAAARGGIGQALHGFFQSLGCSPAAGDHGVAERCLSAYAADIVEDPYRFKNQVGNWDKDGVEALYRASWAGIRQ